VITSVPQHPLKRFLRGRDPARELAESFAANIGRTYRPLLKKAHWTRAQVSLTKEKRLRNLKGSFKARSRISMPERVLLIDDVLTSLATASECAQALKDGGVKEVLVLAAARS
jgi:predicted amidophosphoribosyltransferase